MAEIEIILPKMGESVAEATITTWLKSEGDTVETDESIVEIATDKVDSEVPSPGEGVLSKILVGEGEVAQVGQAIAILSTDGEQPAETPAPAAAEVEAPVAVEAAPSNEKVTPSEEVIAINNSNRFYSPLVKNIAKKESIPQAELDAVPGTGQGGRVTKKDILSYIENRGAAPAEKPAEVKPSVASAPKAAKPVVPSAPSHDHGDNVEIIEMDRMRKLIADHMVLSKHTSPHVTSFVEADVTNIVNWRNKIKDDYFKREGEKFTFTPIFMEALIKAIKDFPMINVSVDDNKIIRKKDINVGMATALPSGNLIVPVIKRADNLNLVGLSKTVNDLATRARNNKLQPDEIQGGTYTITNVGSFGNVMGTPIINQPQAAIMAVGAITKKPAVLETPEGDVIAIRHKMFLSHSYDHRVVDGSLGGMFVRRMADYLENFDINREF
ncbi:MAG: diapophytoene dehydrogenase [Crocinitomicaceae bacterium]|nr:diapophytoene dehydrogenase [Crocinitomicaceae bacterium]|tara:strand:+ start:21751 stop:23070 length:1320 start_codon:yes stop_codon:yes gene_type:complete